MSRLQLILASVLSAAPVLAQSSGAVPVALVGHELVVQFDKIGPSAEQPGLYTWSEVDGWRRLVSYGRRPRWARGRDQLAYWCDGRFWSLRTGDTQARVVGLSTSAVDDAVEWSLDGRTWLLRAVQPMMWVSSYPICRYTQPDAAGNAVPMPLYKRQEREFTGRWSERPDGTQIAYESVRYVADFGNVDGQVRIATIGSAVSEVLSPPGLADAIVLNPQWQPGGSKLAFEAVQRTGGGRMVLLYDSGAHAYMRLAQDGPHPVDGWARDEASLLLSWRPDGKSVLGRYAHGDGVGGYGLDPIPESALTTLVGVEKGGLGAMIGGPTGRVVAHAWKSDGTALAAAVSQRLSPYTQQHMRLCLQQFEDGQASRSRFIDLPAGLQVVDMAW